MSIFISACIALLAIGMVLSHFSQKAERRIRHALSTLPLASRQFTHVAPNFRSALALDPVEGVLHHFAQNGDYIECRSVPAHAIMNAEIYEDGDTISSGTIAAGAAIGGDSSGFGGGLVGPSRSTATVKTIELRITVDDVRSPLLSTSFLSSEALRSSNGYTKASEVARSWYGRIAILVKRFGSDGHNGALTISTRLIAPNTSLDPGRPLTIARGTSQEREDRLTRARLAASTGQRESSPGEHRLDID